MIVSLSTRSGQVVWSEQRKVDETAERVANLQAAGRSQAAIARELGLAKGRISQIVAANKRKIMEPEQQEVEFENGAFIGSKPDGGDDVN